jgi:3-hydroxybutyryl-CoA dehydrogenase
MDVKTVAIIGAGTTGREFAYAAARGGYRVVLEDVSPERLEQGVDWIKQAFDEGVSRGELKGSLRDAALPLISTAYSVEEAIRNADLIIEAVPDELEMKLELFTIFDKFAKPGAILASSSRLFSIGEMTDVTVSRERCIGMRAGDSASGGRVIELVKTPLTSEETVAICCEVARRMGKGVRVVDESPITITTQDIRPNRKAGPRMQGVN